MTPVGSPRDPLSPTGARPQEGHLLGLTTAEQRYLKACWYIHQGDAAITVGAVADRLGVTHPSASSTVNRLAGHGLLRRQERGAVEFTEQGETAALRLVRRHRLLETFLAEVLDFSWDEVHDEAERLEWVISERLEERIALRLGNPTRDPHGDPIPPAEGPHEEQCDLGLADLAPGIEGRIARVADEDPELLRYLSSEGLGIDSPITIEGQEPFGGPLWIRSPRGRHAFGPAAVQAISVTISPPTPTCTDPAPRIHRGRE